MRYFKWGVARLILEPEVCPDIIPIWIDGTQNVMHESRRWPRFVPRAGHQIGIWFGGNVGGEEEQEKGSNSGTVFHELRQRWRDLVQKSEDTMLVSGDGTRASATVLSTGVILSETLKYGEEAVKLREECTMEVRNAVLKVRRMTGLPDEDPKYGLVETVMREEGKGGKGGVGDDDDDDDDKEKREGKMEDGSWVRDT